MWDPGLPLFSPLSLAHLKCPPSGATYKVSRFSQLIPACAALYPPTPAHIHTANSSAFVFKRYTSSEQSLCPSLCYENLLALPPQVSAVLNEPVAIFPSPLCLSPALSSLSNTQIPPAVIMSGSGGFYKYRCKYFYTHNCTNWVYVNNSPCANCLVSPKPT